MQQEAVEIRQFRRNDMADKKDDKDPKYSPSPNILPADEGGASDPPVPEPSDKEPPVEQPGDPQGPTD